MDFDTDAYDPLGTDPEDVWIEARPDGLTASRQNVCLTADLDHP